MMFKRKRKKVLLDEQQAAEFYQALAAYNEALARLPPNWRDIAEGKAELPGDVGRGKGAAWRCLRGRGGGGAVSG